MAPSAPPRFQAAIESPEDALRRASGEKEQPAQVELVARAQRRRRRRPVTTTENPPDAPVGVEHLPTMENP